MPDSPVTIKTVSAAIERAGPVPRGAMRLDVGERSGALADLRTIVLVGMAGRFFEAGLLKEIRAKAGEAGSGGLIPRRSIDYRFKTPR